MSRIRISAAWCASRTQPSPRRDWGGHAAGDPPVLSPGASAALCLLVVGAHVAALGALAQFDPQRSRLPEKPSIVASLIVGGRLEPSPSPSPARVPVSASTRVSAPAPRELAAPVQPKPDAAPSVVSPSDVAPAATASETSPATLAAMPVPGAGVEPSRAFQSAPPVREPRVVSIRAVTYRSPPVLHYPAAARRAHEEGRVDVRVLVDATGAPLDIDLLRSSGYPRLDESALATVRATRFHPYTENGVAMPFRVVMPLVFELEN